MNCDDCVIIDISNKNIKGILDLTRFIKLEELNCAHNQITRIINIPTSLIKLNCEYNCIDCLLELPYEHKRTYQDLEKLLKSDDIINNKYGFYRFFHKWVIKLEYLNCSHNQIKSLCNLGCALYLKEIYWDSNPIEEIVYPNKWESTVKKIYFIDNFNLPLINLPNLIYLDLGCEFSQPINDLPESLIYLKINGKINKSINNLPKSLITKINQSPIIYL